MTDQEKDIAEYMKEERDAYVARIESEGGRVILPGPFEMLLDIDTEDQFNTFHRMIELFSKITGQTPKVKITPSRGGLPKRHIIVATEFPLSNAERVALQAILGSDPIREMFSLFRCITKVKDPTLLVEWEEV